MCTISLKQQKEKLKSQTAGWPQPTSATKSNLNRTTRSRPSIWQNYSTLTTNKRPHRTAPTDHFHRNRTVQHKKTTQPDGSSCSSISWFPFCAHSRRSKTTTTTDAAVLLAGLLPPEDDISAAEKLYRFGQTVIRGGLTSPTERCSRRVGRRWRKFAKGGLERCSNPDRFL